MTPTFQAIVDVLATHGAAERAAAVHHDRDGMCAGHWHRPIRVADCVVAMAAAQVLANEDGAR